MKRPTGKLLRRLAYLTAAVVGLWLLASAGVAYRLTCRLEPPFAEPAPKDWYALRLTTADGEGLGAWFRKGSPDWPVVILLHGLGECRAARLPEAAMLADAGYGVLLVTLRCHGDSTGDVNDFGYGSRHDVAAAVDWLAAQEPGSPRYVWGTSLGSAAAIFAAEALGPRVSGYLLDCPYTDLRTAVRNRTENYLPPPLDRIAYAGLITVAPLFVPDPSRVAPVRAIVTMPKDVPVLILAGSADRRTRLEDVHELHRHVEPQTRLVVIDGADHSQLYRHAPRAYRTAVLDFLATTAGGAGRATSR